MIGMERKSSCVCSNNVLTSVVKTDMRSKVIKIGNSKGLILSKTILEKYEIEDEVNIRLQEDYLIIEPVSKAREGWDEQFIKAKSIEEKEPLIPDVFEDEQLLEW